jgi:CrcB protein
LLDALTGHLSQDERARSRRKRRADHEPDVRGIYKTLFQLMATPARYQRFGPKLWAAYYDGNFRIDMPDDKTAVCMVSMWNAHHPFILRSQLRGRRPRLRNDGVQGGARLANGMRVARSSRREFVTIGPPGSSIMERPLWICLAGAVGTGTRYLVSIWAARTFGLGFPWGTLIVTSPGASSWGGDACRAAIGVHVADGATAMTGGSGASTYSSFNYETTRLSEGATTAAIANFGATLVGFRRGPGASSRRVSRAAK